MQNGWVWQWVMSDIGMIPAIGLRIAWWQHCKRNNPWRRNRQGNFVYLKIGGFRLSVLECTCKKTGRCGQTADNRNSVREVKEFGCILPKNATPLVLDIVNNFGCRSCISGLQCEMQEAVRCLYVLRWRQQARPKWFEGVEQMCVYGKRVVAIVCGGVWNHTRLS